MSLGDSHSDGDSTGPDDGGYGGTGQTRTRYHDQGNSGLYGGARRTKSSRGMVHGDRRGRPADRGHRHREPRRRRFLYVQFLLHAGNGSDSDSANGPDAAPTAASGESGRRRRRTSRPGSRTTGRASSPPRPTTRCPWARPACSARTAAIRSSTPSSPPRPPPNSRPPWTRPIRRASSPDSASTRTATHPRAARSSPA